MDRRVALVTIVGAVAGATGIGATLLLKAPRNTGERIVTAQAIRRVGPDEIFVDFGKVWFGNVVLAANFANQGRKVTVRLGEKLDDAGRIDRRPFGSVRYHEADVTLSRTEASPELAAADLRGMEAGRAAMPFRYLELVGWEGELPASAVSLIATISTQFSPRGGIVFTGANATAQQLKRLMQLGWHTMAATSFMGIFVDGDRERTPYEADGYINQLGWYAISGDTSVPRRTIEALLQKPTWPSEWMIQLIFMARADYLATGDTEYLGGIFDRLQIFSLRAFVDAGGLVNTTDKHLAERFVAATGADYLQDIVDWPPIERDGHEMVTHNTVVNAFVHAGFEAMAMLAGALGRTAEATSYAIAAERLKAVMEDRLVDRNRGVFVDGLGSSHVSAHSLFFPLAFGLVPPDRVAPTMAMLKARILAYKGGFPCSVYGAQYLLEALYRQGEGDLALALILNPTERGWLHMLNAHDATVTHEAWDINYKENLDWTHAWGSAFLNIAHRFILGARPLKPRWSQWTLTPDSAVRLAMTATIPTPMGDIEVEIDPESDAIRIRHPQSAAFIASPPRGNEATWKFDLRPYASEQ